MEKVLKNKGCVSLVICLLLLVFAQWQPVAADEEMPITVTVDGVQIAFDEQPIFENDRVLVPMRFIFEALGAEVTWDDALQKATAKKGTDTIEITIDNDIMLKNGEEVVLDVPARMVGDRTLVPVRAVSEGMGADVDWIDEKQQVVIVSNTVGQTAPAPPPAEPTATKTPDAEKPTEEQTYEAITLSPADMQTLKNSYDNLIRYNFEQTALPQSVLKDNTEIVKEITAKSENAVTFVKDVWNWVVMQRIMQIQLLSKEVYNFGNGTEDILDKYMNIVEDAGLEASNYFDVSFETLSDKSTMMLISFKETDTLMACKFIGVVVRPSKSVRYFTAETDLFDKDNLYFCEVTMNARGTIGLIGFEKDEFITAAEITLEKHLAI